MALIGAYLGGMGTRQAIALAVFTGMAVACSPTVKFEAPDEPIVLEINITIQQEVLIRVDRALDDVFAEQGDIFGLSGD
ncbi:MAG: YnbE family lipoprotein [Alphaproteobacteria bacterium]